MTFTNARMHPVNVRAMHFISLYRAYRCVYKSNVRKSRLNIFSNGTGNTSRFQFRLRILDVCGRLWNSRETIVVFLGHFFRQLQILLLPLSALLRGLQVLAVGLGRVTHRFDALIV